MENQLIIRNPEPLLASAKRVESGEDALMHLPATSFELGAFTVPPPPGYYHPKAFPYCCEYHKDMFTRACQVYDNFPDCCAEHRQLHNSTWFRKLDYIYVPFKIVSLVAYLHDKICEFYFHPNWQKEITDYITYSIKSFGQLPEGFGSPVGLSMYIAASSAMIEELELLRPDQRVALLKCLHPNQTELNEPTDLNLLHKIYKDWLDLFPFHLPMFQHLKAHFQKEMPFLKGPGQTNRYTGLTCIQLKTRQELKDLLLGMTRLLLKEINSVKLYEEGFLLQPDKVRLDIALAQRKMRLEEDALTPVTEKTDFIRLLDKWYSDEKEFLKDVEADVLKNSPMQFISDLLDGMKALQDNGVNETCIKTVRDGGPDRESQVRYWFRNWFRGRYPDATVTVEEEQGNGYIDLRILRRGVPDRIIEFKGWWNADKLEVPEQVCRYLTDFERDGYILMINHLKKTPVDEQYKAIITAPAMNYTPDSWGTYRYRQTDVHFYVSRHQFDGKEKTIYHFIFNVYF